MGCRVCICCGELREAGSFDAAAQNPHICDSCATLLAEMEECSAPMHPLNARVEPEDDPPN